MLDAALRRDSNNYDLLRLILATTVIFAHAHRIQPSPPQPDPATAFLPTGDSGNLAVIVFFVLSGIFVTDSLLTRQSLLQFAIMRTCRIFPGLLVCLLCTAFLQGLVFTTLSMVDYLRSPNTLSYIYRNLALTDLQWRLPGVFTQHAYGLDGSLWTLPTEVRLYVALGLLYAVGCLRRRLTALLTVIIALYLFYQFDPVPDAARFALIAAFAAGASLAICKHLIPLSPAIAAALALTAATAVSVDHLAGPLFYAAVAYALLLIFTLPALRRLRLPGDYSYGVYIYGFPVQQGFAHAFPAATPLTNAACSALLSLVIAILSWRLIEHPAMAFGRALNTRKLKLAPALVLATLGLAPLTVRALPGWGERAPLPSDLIIVAVGPGQITHGQPFNVQPNGDSALWATATRSLNPGAQLIIGGVALKGVVYNNLIAAAVPMALIRDPGAISIVIQEQRDGHPSPSAPVVVQVW